MGSSLSYGAFALVLIAGTILTIPSSLVLAWLYQRAVRAAMHKSGGAAEEVIALGSLHSRAPDLRVVEITSVPSALSGPSNDLLRAATLGPWRAAAIYALGGIIFGLCSAILFMYSSQIDVSPSRLVGVTLAFAFPVLIARNLITTASRWMQLRNLAIYVAPLLILLNCTHS